MPTAAQLFAAGRDPVADAWLMLVELQEEHSGSEILRVARNNADVMHNGNVFYKSSFEIRLPGASDEEPRAGLQASNVTRAAGRRLMLARHPIRVRLIVIDAAAPDAAVIDTNDLLKVGRWSADGMLVDLELKARASHAEPLPFQRTSRHLYPAVWMTR
jgi:hypothetical protein